jgi:hypothetical protein
MEMTKHLMMLWVSTMLGGSYTVTRPYAGFRHPDRMAPDQTVRGGENDYSIWSGNFLPHLPKFSVITGIFRHFLPWKNE